MPTLGKLKNSNNSKSKCIRNFKLLWRVMPIVLRWKLFLVHPNTLMNKVTWKNFHLNFCTDALYISQTSSANLIITCTCVWSALRATSISYISRSLTDRLICLADKIVDVRMVKPLSLGIGSACNWLRHFTVSRDSHPQSVNLLPRCDSLFWFYRLHPYLYWWVNISVSR